MCSFFQKYIDWLIDWLIDWDEEIVLDNTGFHDKEVFDKQNLTGCEHSESYLKEEGNDVFTLNGRIKRKFVSKNLVNLYKRKLTKLKVQDIFSLTKLLFNEKIRFYQWKVPEELKNFLSLADIYMKLAPQWYSTYQKLKCDSLV